VAEFGSPSFKSPSSSESTALDAVLLGLLELVDTDDSFHIGSVNAVMPTMTARQVRITRHCALGILSLIIIGLDLEQSA